MVDEESVKITCKDCDEDFLFFDSSFVEQAGHKYIECPNCHSHYELSINDLPNKIAKEVKAAKAKEKAKKLEESKPASEMSIEELEAAIKAKTAKVYEYIMNNNQRLNVANAAATLDLPAEEVEKSVFKLVSEGKLKPPHTEK